MEIDFEGGAPDVKDDNGVANTDSSVVNQEDTTDLNSNPDVADIQDTTTEDVDDAAADVDDQTSSTGELTVGDIISYEGTDYTIAENGDLVDDKGNVFIKADEVQNWLDSNNISEPEDEVTDESDINIDNLVNAFGIEITDDNGEPVTFENNVSGIKNYVESVIGTKAQDIEQGAINKLFDSMPMLKDFIDYVHITGSPRGFGEIPDRSGIQLDKNNEAQLEAIIKMAAKEFGNTSLNDNYIAYLKTSNALYDEAKAQLANLIERDKQIRQDLETRADEVRKQQEQDLRNYWQSVYTAINKRNIGGYKIPDTFVKTVDGRKLTLTPDDFYDYLSKGVATDEEGNTVTAYQKDLAALSDEEALNRELLAAWLMFTNGSYKDLVSMAVNENEVRRLIVKARQQRSSKTVKVSKRTKDKVNPDDILF